VRNTKAIDTDTKVGTTCTVTRYVVQTREGHYWETQDEFFDIIPAMQQSREFQKHGTAPVRVVKVELPGEVV
jgi:hypothetical protein